jgi:hypothetical protein
MTFAAFRARSFRTSRPILNILLILFTLAVAAWTQDVPKTGSLSTDKLDYQPGDIVTITGENWAPGETVTMVVGEDPQVHPDRALVAVADENGNFKNTDFAIEQDHLGVHFMLVAVGATSGNSASIQFYDSLQSAGTNTIYDYTIQQGTGTISPATQAIAGLNSNQNAVAPIALPFDFKFYGINYPTGTNIAISNNGVIHFFGNLSTGNNVALSTTTTAKALLPYWDNLFYGANGAGVFRSTTGSAGSQVLTIEWRNVRLNNNGGGNPVITFQARLFEGTNRIEFIYGGLATSAYADSATIGLIYDPNHYTQHSFNDQNAVGPGMKLTLIPGTALDLVAPVVTVPADITQEATGALTPVTYSGQSATDDVDGPITTVTCTPASGSNFALGTTTITCKAKDNAGNEGTNTFKVNVTDTTPPAIDVAGLTDGVLNSEQQVVTFTATASDLVNGNVAVTCSPVSGSTFAFGPTTVNCSAKDAANNTGNFSFTVLVEDSVAPVLTLPQDITEEAKAAAGNVVTFSVSANDAVDGDRPVTCDHNSGDTFPLGTTTVKCSATDKAENKAEGTFTILVRDTTAPSLTVPSDITAEATGPTGAAVTFTATATDLVDPNPAVTCTPSSGSIFTLGETTVSCKARDASNNESAAKTFKVKVQDTTPPDLTVPANITAEATGPNGAAVTFTVSAQDLVDGAVTPDCDATSGATFGLGTHTVKCTASDVAGNTSAEKSFTITVRDTTPPALTVPGNIVAEATGPTGAIVAFSASATDIVDGAVTPDCDATSGATFPLGVRTVTCTAKDAAGNVNPAKSFTITVQDTTAPVLSLPGNISEVATSALGNVITYSATASDIVDVTVPVICSRASGSTFLGTTVVTCAATDQHNNAASGSFTVTVTFGRSGFLQPINVDGSSAFKLGSTVPVKFQLGGASAAISNLVAKIYVAKVSNSVVGAELEAVSTSAATTGNLFRYDPIAQQYIFNWGTKGQSLGTYQIRADFGDGVQRTVLVSLR